MSTRREALWKELADVSDNLQEAYLEVQTNPSPQNRHGMEAACHRYCEKLAPVVGQSVAFAFEAAMRELLDAQDRDAVNAALGKFDEAENAANAALDAAQAMDEDSDKVQ